MNVSIYNQLFNFLIFIITGIIIGILFDIFRIIRKSFKTADFITYIQDIIFWILAGSILLFTIFTFNNGKIRIYIFIGLLLGIIVYLLTLSKYFIKINVGILNFLKKIIYFPFYTIFNFIKRFIYQPLSDFFTKIINKFQKRIKSANQKTNNSNFPNICNKFDK